MYFQYNLVDFITFLQMKTDIEEERHFYYCLLPFTHTLKMHTLDLLIVKENYDILVPYTRMTCWDD